MHRYIVPAIESIQMAYERGRKAAFYGLTYRDNPHCPRFSPRLHEAWQNGVSDEMESFS